MRRTFVSLLVVLFLSLFLITAGCMQNEPGIAASTSGSSDTPQQRQYTSNESLVAFVEGAVAYVEANGKEKALAEFNDPNGTFVRGELYIYAYDFNGTTLAHPVNPERVGLSRLNETEGDVGIFLREMSDVVRNGDGFYRFTYVNPAHNRSLEWKLGYGVQMDEDWWLGSGIYLGPADSKTVPATATPATSGYPEMRGIWRSNDGLVYFLDDTVQKMPAGENAWVINSQDDRVISGFKVFSLPDGAIENQTIVGIFDPDGKTISFIDRPGGWATGSLVDPDTLFIAWTNPGENTVSMAGTLTLHRQQ